MNAKNTGILEGNEAPRVTIRDAPGARGQKKKHQKTKKYIVNSLYTLIPCGVIRVSGMCCGREKHINPAAKIRILILERGEHAQAGHEKGANTSTRADFVTLR